MCKKDDVHHNDVPSSIIVKSAPFSLAAAPKDPCSQTLRQVDRNSGYRLPPTCPRRSRLRRQVQALSLERTRKGRGSQSCQCTRYCFRSSFMRLPRTASTTYSSEPFRRLAPAGPRWISLFLTRGLFWRDSSCNSDTFRVSETDSTQFEKVSLLYRDLARRT